MPVGVDTTIRVSLFLGGPGTNFDFLTLSFQVPRKGSAWASTKSEKERAKTMTVATASSCLRVFSFSSFLGDLSVKNCSFTVAPVPRTNEDIFFTCQPP